MKYIRWIALALVLAMCLPLAACGGSAQKVNGNALLQVMLERVTFDTEITDAGDISAYYFQRGR